MVDLVEFLTQDPTLLYGKLQTVLFHVSDGATFMYALQTSVQKS